VTCQPVHPVVMTTGLNSWPLLVLRHIRCRHALCLWWRLSHEYGFAEPRTKK
jgi:hypothetical protein